MANFIKLADDLKLNLDHIVGAEKFADGKVVIRLSTDGEHGPRPVKEESRIGQRTFDGQDAMDLWNAMIDVG